MFNIFKKKRISKYKSGAILYIERITKPKVEKNKNSDDGVIVRYSLTSGSNSDEIIKKRTRNDNNEVTAKLSDVYDSTEVTSLMKKYDPTNSSQGLMDELEKFTDKTFTDVLAMYIKNSYLKESEIYKAAQMDRRLFSKIMSDREYKPAKDTAVALAFALHLTLAEATDLLSRAGYTLSHSNKKDIIIEYFFRERIYNLGDINCVLYDLGQKTIGR